MTQQFYVRFVSDETEHKLFTQYIGPFDTEDDAADYADQQNQGLADRGVPGWVASYDVL